MWHSLDFQTLKVPWRHQRSKCIWFCYARHVLFAHQFRWANNYLGFRLLMQLHEILMQDYAIKEKDSKEKDSILILINKNLGKSALFPYEWSFFISLCLNGCFSIRPSFFNRCCDSWKYKTLGLFRAFLVYVCSNRLSKELCVFLYV